MRSRLIVAFLVAALLAAGCTKSPKKVFNELQDAALKKDTRAIYNNLSPETVADLARRAQALYREPQASSPPASAKTPASKEEGYEYLAMLALNLDDLTREYIRTLRPANVTVTGGTAVMTLGSIRFGPPEKTLTFKKVKGKWLWDAREILEWYLEHKQEISSFC